MAADYAQILKLNRLLTGYRTMVILKIHPGYFAYSLSSQRLTISYLRVDYRSLQNCSKEIANSFK